MYANLKEMPLFSRKKTRETDPWWPVSALSKSCSDISRERVTYPLKQLIFIMQEKFEVKAKLKPLISEQTPSPAFKKAFLWS